MSSQSVRVCDQCQGVIPESAPRILMLQVEVVSPGGSQPFVSLDFCSTDDFVAYMQAAITGVQKPNPPYPPLPKEAH